MWIASKVGKFSIKSTMRIIRAGNAQGAAEWRWVWKVHVPYRVQIFMWLLLHNKILTNAEQFRWNMANSPRCAICSADLEDLDHLLRYRQNATTTWQAVHSHEVHRVESNALLSTWLQHNLSE